MPEVTVPEEVKKVGEEAMDTAREHAGVLHWSKMRELVEKADLEFVGGGSECVVIGGADGEKVLKVDYREKSPQEMKGYFYRQRVMEALFPENFPHFMAAGILKNSEVGVTVSSRVNRGDGVVKHSFNPVMAAITDLKLPVFIETDVFNFAIGKDGGEYYIDRVESDSGEWDKEAIFRYLKKQHASDDRFRIVEKSLERLKELGED